MLSPFPKPLNKQIDDILPDWKDKFLCYKILKKQLRKIYSKHMKLIADDEFDSVAHEKDVANFVRLCQQEIDKFNNFVLHKQEWYITKMEALEGKLVAAKDSNQELMEIGRDLAELHAEIVLLLNYTALNYIGLVKILKKRDKLSGALGRSPFIQKVLNEPFYKTDVQNNLVKKCETMLAQIFSMNKDERSSSFASTRSEENTLSNGPEEKSFVGVPEELVDIKNKETYMKLTHSALKILKEIRSGSSTVNMFSLLPIR